MSLKVTHAKNKEIIVHDFDRTIAHIFRAMERELSETNFQLLKKYDKEMVKNSLGKATRSKNLSMVMSLTRMLRKDWNEVTKTDIDDFLYEVMQKYTVSGQETYTTWDHKKVLKIFFRWLKLGSRDSKIVGDPEETKYIRLKPVRFQNCGPS